VDVNVELTDQLFAMFDGYDVARRQPPVLAPIYVAIGRHDYQVPYTTWDEHRRGIGNLTLVLFEQSGHIPHWEEPERFAAELARWRQQH